MRLLYDKWPGSPYEIVEFTKLQISMEIYYGSNGEVYDIDIRDENDEDDVYRKIDNTKFDYFPDELQAIFTMHDGYQISCYMEVGRTKDRFHSIIKHFDELLDKIAETGYCKQSEFDFAKCSWQ
jgi:hypothetical protein